MKLTRTLTMGALLIFSSLPSLTAQKLVPVAKGYSKTSVNTAIFRNNSLVTFKNYQFIAYYDADCYLTLGKRKNGSTEWELCRSAYKGNCRDAHNVISFTVDGAGYIHIAFDHHGNPLNYCKGKAPFSLELEEKQPMVGRDEKDVTYPEFYKLKNGDLIFAYRSGGSGRGNLVLNRYDRKSESWSRIQDVLLDGEGKRNAYWQLVVDPRDVIHISWVWRETPAVETNHDLCYARSSDYGKSWEKSDGTSYELPIRASNAEYACRIPQKSELINQTSMSTDKKGNPYIATYWRDQESNIPQYRLVWWKDGVWYQQQVSQRTTPFSLSGGGTKMIPIARPRVVVKERKGKTSLYYIYRDVERESKVSMGYCADLESGKWQFSDLTPFSVNAWEPSLDTELWKKREKLQIFVQNTAQGDGERTVETEPQQVYVLELEK